MSISRRDFISALAAPALVGLARKTPRRVAGGFVDDGGSVGHRLRDGGRFEAPRRERRATVVIVGGGIAGLSAAWWLERHGVRDFVVLELEQQAGGNARWGENEITRFPWAAHYVPVPDLGATLVRTLMEELGVLRDGAWEERQLCFAPQERLFLHGEWHAGLEPEFALPAWERAEFRRFEARMAELRATGAFTIPSCRASAHAEPPAVAGLDATSMHEWLARERFRSPALHWYVDYACRDDYGAHARDTSAWAGVHYFTSRPEHEEQGPLTWPEGNGFVVRRLLERFGDRVVTGAPAYRIEADGARGVRVLTPGLAWRAESAIVAAPAFVAARIVDGATRPPHLYSPWLTANLVLDRWPRERRTDAPPAWDNVVHGSPSLGYVVATHQSLAVHEPRTVWTFYHALADLPPKEARAFLLSQPWEGWVEWILDDLARAHPDIRECVTRVDVMRMGHAMVRPAPGFRSWTDPAHGWRLPTLGGRLAHAHSDMTGLSLFEEAQERGVAAATQLLARMGG